MVIKVILVIIGFITIRTIIIIQYYNIECNYNFNKYYNCYNSYSYNIELL